MASPPRLRRSIGANSGTKTVAFVVAAVMIAADIFFVLRGVMVVSDQFAERAHDWAVTAAVLFVGLSVAIYVASAAACVMLGVLRTGAWLEGTTLRMRVAFRPTSVDLATADIHCGLQGKTLIARDPRSGSTLTLTLRGPGSVRLPSAQLRALAEAIGQGRARASSEDEAAMSVKVGLVVEVTSEAAERAGIYGRGRSGWWHRLKGRVSALSAQDVRMGEP